MHICMYIYIYAVVKICHKSASIWENLYRQNVCEIQNYTFATPHTILGEYIRIFACMYISIHRYICTYIHACICMYVNNIQANKRPSTSKCTQRFSLQELCLNSHSTGTNKQIGRYEIGSLYPNYPLKILDILLKGGRFRKFAICSTNKPF